jgi:hypothetical protein
MLAGMVTYKYRRQLHEAWQYAWQHPLARLSTGKQVQQRTTASNLLPGVPVRYPWQGLQLALKEAAGTGLHTRTLSCAHHTT